MIPFLTYPLALIALAGLPALAAIYILRNRYRRRTVSSLVLWRFQVQSKAGGARVNRLQLPLLFFLELLILLLLVVAATGPHWQLPWSARPLIVVLDDSFSLRAGDAGDTAQHRARVFLEKLFRFQPPPSTRLILAGHEPRSLGAAAKSWREVETLLPQWTCQSPDAALEAAITLAADIGKRQANILVLTDHAPAEKNIGNIRLEWHAFGRPLANLAFVNASRTAFGEKDRCLLEVANFSSAAQMSPLVVRLGTNRVQSTSLLLGPNENRRIVFNVPATAPALQAELSDDALAIDNEIQLLPPERRRVRVQVSLKDEMLATLVNRTLDATGLRAALSANPELVIHETDSAPGSNTWSLCWADASATNAFTGPFLVDGSHPLAQGLGLEGAVWAAADLTNATGTVPVVMAGNISLFSGRADELGRQRLTVNFNPRLSTVQNTPAWPILFWNLLNWRISAMPGLQENNLRLGADAHLKCNGVPVALVRPDGDVLKFPQTGDELALETPVPGIYSVMFGGATNLFSVNVLAADESDLSQAVAGQWGRWSETVERRMNEASLVWPLALLALALLAAHLWLVARGKGTA